MIRVRTNNQLIVGLTDFFKYNTAVSAVKGNKIYNIVQLAVTRPVMTVLFVDFNPITKDVALQIGEFNFVTPDGYLRITNTEEYFGLVPAVPPTNAIPLVQSIDAEVNDVVRSSIVPYPVMI